MIPHSCFCKPGGVPIYSGALPKYEEQINCPECGRDHSIRPPKLWRLRYGIHQLAKRRRLLGLLETVKTFVVAFQLPRERAEEKPNGNRITTI